MDRDGDGDALDVWEIVESFFFFSSFSSSPFLSLLREREGNGNEGVGGRE